MQLLAVLAQGTSAPSFGPAMKRSSDVVMSTTTRPIRTSQFSQRRSLNGRLRYAGMLSRVPGRRCHCLYLRVRLQAASASRAGAHTLALSAQTTAVVEIEQGTIRNLSLPCRHHQRVCSGPQARPAVQPLP
jgi:hypothetical protein